MAALGPRDAAARAARGRRGGDAAHQIDAAAMGD